MKNFLKNAGFILVLLGVFFLIAPFFTHLQTNTSLLIGWILVAVGIVVYTIIKKIEN